MSDYVTQAVEALFPSEGRSVSNVKFFQGTRTEVSASELAHEILRADTQIRDGQAVLVEDIDGDLDN
jgi:hypothetical protein